MFFANFYFILFFLELADSYRAINNNLKGKNPEFSVRDLIVSKKNPPARAGSYFRLNFNTVFAFKTPKIFGLRRTNFRRGLIFIKISAKSQSGVLLRGGVYC